MSIKKLLFNLLLFASVGITAQVPNYVTQDSLVGWWGFNGNANDESGNGNDGTVNGPNLTIDRFGNANSAYDFDGINDYISTLSYFDTEQRTISIWFNLAAYSTTTQPIVSNDFPSLVHGHTIISIQNTDSLTLRCGTMPFRLPPTQLDQWNNVVFTRDLNNTKYWFNGALIQLESNGTLHSNNTSSNNFLFGTTRLFDRYFNGSIDDIGIWNRALDSCEIKDLYNANLINCTSGINELDNSAVDLFPNPTNRWVTLSLSKTTNGQIILTDVVGKEVLRKNFNANLVELDLYKLNTKGTYFAKVLDADGSLIAIKKMIYQ